MDEADSIVSVALLRDSTAAHALEQYIVHHASKYGNARFIVPDRGSNLASDHWTAQLGLRNSVVLPIPTEAPWSIHRNERSHATLKAMLTRHDLQFPDNQSAILAVAEVAEAWNSVQHSDGSIPFVSRFGQLPRLYGDSTDPVSNAERLSFAAFAREQIAEFRARRALELATAPYKSLSVRFKTFEPGETLWFHRRAHGWRKGKFIDSTYPTINVKFGNRIYPTHYRRVAPALHNKPPPPQAEASEAAPYDAPITENESDGTDTQINLTAEPEQPSTPHNIAVSSYPNMALYVHVLHAANDHQIVLQHPSSRLPEVKDANIMTEVLSEEEITEPEDIQGFKDAKKEEIEYLLQNAVKLASADDADKKAQKTGLRWVLTRKTNPITGKRRYRARLVALAHRSSIRHLLHGNAPTVRLSSLRAMLGVAPLWNESSETGISIMCRDVTKA